MPFDAPSETVFRSDPDQEEEPTSDNNKKKKEGTKVEGEGAKTGLKALAPIAGHVSVVTSLTMIPSGPGRGGGLLVTGDRDEHIRVSRYPQGWAVERYLLGHRKFVGALLWLPRPAIADADAGETPSRSASSMLCRRDCSLTSTPTSLTGSCSCSQACAAKVR